MMKYFKILIFLITPAFLCCKSTDNMPPQLSVSASTISFPIEGATLELTIDCNDEWSTNNPASWLELSQTTGGSGSTTIQLTAETLLLGYRWSTEQGKLYRQGSTHD